MGVGFVQDPDVALAIAGAGSDSENVVAISSFVAKSPCLCPTSLARDSMQKTQVKDNVVYICCVVETCTSLEGKNSSDIYVNGEYLRHIE